MITYDNLPLYDVFLDEEKGLEFISIVEMPAIEKNFIAFNEDIPIKMSVNEEQMIITGPALIPNKPIYRYLNGQEFYITFSEKTIKDLMLKFMKDKSLGVNLEHTYETENASIVESYIVNREKGILHSDFADLPDGTWMVSMKVHSDKLWQLIKEDKLNGFSIEGIMNLQPAKAEIKQSNQNIFRNFMNKKSLKMFFKSLLAQLGSVETDKAILNWDGDAELAVGMEVFIEGEDDYIAPEDGDYTTADGKVIKVVDGKVAEIIDHAAEVAPEEVETEMSEVVEEELAEETVENPTNEGEETDTEAIVKIREELNEAYRRIDELTRELQELKETVAKLAEAPVEMSAIETVIAEETDKVSGFAALRKNRK